MSEFLGHLACHLPFWRNHPITWDNLRTGDRHFAGNVNTTGKIHVYQVWRLPGYFSFLFVWCTCIMSNWKMFTVALRLRLASNSALVITSSSNLCWQHRSTYQYTAACFFVTLISGVLRTKLHFGKFVLHSYLLTPNL